MPNESTVGIIIEAQDRASAQLKSVQGSLNNVKSRMQDMQPVFQRMAAIGTVAFGAITAGILQATIASSNAQETISKFGVVFGDVGAEAEAVAKDLRDNFGLASSSAKKLLGDTGDLLTGFGFTGAAALSLSERTNKLAVDLASFTNVEGGAERASKALTKALLGERESVKELGISIQESEIKRRLSEKGLDNLTGAALRQAKAEITLEIAISQSKNAMGDFARTADSTANQLKVSRERLKELNEELGNVFEPILNDILTAILPVIESTAKWIEANPELVKNIVIASAAITGLIAVVGALGLVLPVIMTGFTLIVSTVGLATIAILGIGWAMKNAYDITVLLLNDWEDVWAGLPSVIEDAVNSITAFWKPLLDTIDKISNSFQNLGKTIRQSVGGAVSGIGNVLGGSVGNVISVNDAIITPRGDIIKPADDDFIIATKNPQGLSGGTYNFNFAGANIGNRQDLMREIKQTLSRSMELSNQGVG